MQGRNSFGALLVGGKPRLVESADVRVEGKNTAQVSPCAPENLPMAYLFDVGYIDWP